MDHAYFSAAEIAEFAFEYAGYPADALRNRVEKFWIAIAIHLPALLRVQSEQIKCF